MPRRDARTGIVLRYLGMLPCALAPVACGAGSATPSATPPAESAGQEAAALESLELTRVLPTTAETLYAAWIDGEGHAAFTGSPATVDPKVGGKHTAWNGYISGELLELEPGKRIVMSWRTKEFPEGAADSRVELRFADTDGGVELTIVHTSIPSGQGSKYEEGWDGHYFKPIEKHYGQRAAAE